MVPAKRIAINCLLPRELYVDMRVKFEMIIIKVFKWFVLIYTNGHNTLITHIETHTDHKGDASNIVAKPSSPAPPLNLEVDIYFPIRKLVREKL